MGKFTSENMPITHLGYRAEKARNSLDYIDLTSHAVMLFYCLYRFQKSSPGCYGQKGHFSAKGLTTKQIIGGVSIIYHIYYFNQKPDKSIGAAGVF